MTNSRGIPLILVALLAVSSTITADAPPAFDSSQGDELLARYFEIQTRNTEQACLAEIQSAEDWNAQKDAYRAQLQSMLGLMPWPEKTPLQATVTGTVDHEEFAVEKVHFQSSPQLYVTGSLYVPKERSGKLPGILYVCGHGRIVEDGVSLGNKAHYQHHGAWFARNGYVCLIIDTIQLGEIEGLHHGTYREGMWWWNNRGYTPAGVEAWNGIRALDYLQSREEVDPDRLGVTGRSGGGAYSWWVAALDERVKAAVPVAGITSMRNHIVDGCIEGHCDCMYMVNSEAWDFAMVSALVAPRALLISNTDKDRIFPLDGVVDVYNKTRRIYKLLDAEQRIGLNIAEGPHKDIQELRVHAFHWFDRFLKDDEQLIRTVAEKLLEPKDLKVFDELPSDERVTIAHEWFVPQAHDSSTLTELQEIILGKPALSQLGTELGIQSSVVQPENGSVTVTHHSFVSEEPYRLPLVTVERSSGNGTSRVHLHILTQSEWEETFDQSGDGQLRADAIPNAAEGEVHAYLTPRGIGATEWTRDERERTHIRRRFNLLGRTLDSARIFDVQRATEALRALYGGDVEITLHGENEAANWALHTAPLTRNVTGLKLHNVTTDYRSGPYFLNLTRRMSLADVVRHVCQHCPETDVTFDRQERQQAWEELCRGESKKL
ncbi:MAG: acetylxylan esterase [Planctomycetaceae bacterium]|nr:acetylxylan esterase [Planctomycetaceae bacterium]